MIAGSEILHSVTVQEVVHYYYYYFILHILKNDLYDSHTDEINIIDDNDNLSASIYKNLYVISKSLIYKIMFLHTNNICKLLNWFTCTITGFVRYMFKNTENATRLQSINILDIFIFHYFQFFLHLVYNFNSKRPFRLKIKWN